MSYRIALLGVATLVAALGLVPAASAKTPERRVSLAVHLLGKIPGAVTVRCVGDGDLVSEQSFQRGSTVYGDYDPDLYEMRFSYSKVCTPFARYRRTGRLDGRVLMALSTIGHEAAHALGTQNEAAAECQGVRSALRLLRRYGAERWQIDTARRLLGTNADRYRSPKYQLRNVRCRL